MNKKYSTIQFHEKTGARILNGAIAKDESGVFGIYGDDGVGKSIVCEQIKTEAKKSKIIYLELSQEEIINSKFLLWTLANKINDKIKNLVKELSYYPDIDYKEIKKILKIPYQTTDEKKSVYREKLILFLQIVNELLKKYQVKIITCYDDVDKNSSKDILKVLQLLRYIKIYVPEINVFAFYNKESILKKVVLNSYDVFSLTYLNTSINLNQSWKRYDLENDMIYSFIIENKISNVSDVLFLLTQNELYINFYREIARQYKGFKFMHYMLAELEFLTFIFAYWEHNNTAQLDDAVNSIMSFYLTKDEAAYTTTEFRNHENKKFFKKMRAFIDFFNESGLNYSEDNKYASIVKNIYYPYNCEWQIYFTHPSDKNKVRENNLNSIFPLFAIYFQYQFIEKKENTFWFSMNDENLEPEMQSIFSLILTHRNNFKINDNNEKLLYYKNILDFLLHLTKSYLKKRIKN